MNANEQKVLKAMMEEGQEFYHGFRGLCCVTQLDRKVVRRSCRSLARKELTKFGKGLWNEDGEPCGSGYALTEQGRVEASRLLTEVE